MPRESELKKLGDEQKATVLSWIEDGATMREVIEKIAKAEPEGFGITTNLGTLSRMVALWRTEQLLKARPEEAERARALLKNEAESIAFQRATIAVLQQRLFQSAVECRDGREQRETLRMLLEHEIKIRKLELAERKLEERKRQFEFNAARMAMKHWHEFREIDEMEGPDDEDKIWMARDAMFVGPNGESPVRPRIEEMTNDPGTDDEGTPVRGSQVSQRTQMGKEKACAEVVHKSSLEKGEKSSNGGVNEGNEKRAEPVEGGKTCEGGGGAESHPQISQSTQMGKEDARAEVVHKSSMEKEEKSSIEGMKIGGKKKGSEPAEAGTTCEGENDK